MTWDGPLATLRLSAKGLELERPDRLLRLGDRLADIRTKPGVWLVTTDGYTSPKPEDHLGKVIAVFTANIDTIRRVFPDVVASFSLLVFDPDFTQEDLSKAAVSAATEFGSLTVEVPGQSKEFVFDGRSVREYAA